ncbi:hypothetical protein C0992_003258 [Termitomyces sp. T32_za158]|nr:hypothetical protein C0992_003258 [Termitomyces sp. T32_za158]
MLSTETVKSVKSKVQIRYLAHNAEQQQATALAYAENQHECHIFVTGDLVGQQQALALLKTLGLLRESRDQLECRWTAQWSNSWSVGDAEDERRRTLYQW